MAVCGFQISCGRCTDVHLCLFMCVHACEHTVCVCAFVRAFRPLCLPAVGPVSKTPSNTFSQQRRIHLTEAPDAKNTEPALAAKVKYII